MLLKRGQITIFVVVGVLLVTAIAFFFILRSGVVPKLAGQKPETNFNSFMSACLESKVKEATKIISINGGYVSESSLSIKFKFSDEGVYRNISFLCYTLGNFKPCINQKPTLFLDVQKGIKDYISNDVQNCFNKMIDSLKSQGYDVTNQVYNGFSVDLSPKKIIIQTDSSLTLGKSGETTTQKDFSVSLPSRIYETQQIANEILNEESQFCYFETTGFVLTRPEFTIDKFTTSDSIKIYSVKHKNSDDIFRFAVRGCVSPPGL